MPAWNDQPETAFKESCCDGGGSNAYSSGQPCGCDPGYKNPDGRIGYVCRWHESEYGTTLYPSPLDNPIKILGSISFITGSPIVANTSVRKQYPVATGVLDYFPDAIREVAHVSWAGNQQHHPDKPLHWDRSKSTDEADALMRHFLERGTRDTDGMRHTAKVAWRALALLQKEIESEEGQ